MSSRSTEVIDYSDITVYENLQLVSIEQTLFRPYCNIKTIKQWLHEYTDGQFNFKILKKNPSSQYLFFRCKLDNSVVSRSCWPNVFGFLRTLKSKSHSNGWQLDNFLALIQNRVRQWVRRRRAHRLRFQLAVRDPRSKLWGLLQLNGDVLQLIEHFYWQTRIGSSKKKNMLLETAW